MIEETENLDLLISYVALHNHLSSLTRSLFQLLSTREHLDSLLLLMGCEQCEL